MDIHQTVSNAKNLGLWGVITMLEMTYRLLLGSVVLIRTSFPPYPEFGDSLTVPLARLVGLTILATGLLFAFVGNVASVHARKRILWFAIALAVAELIWCGMNVEAFYDRPSPSVALYSLESLLIFNAFIIILCAACLFLLSREPTFTAS